MRYRLTILNGSAGVFIICILIYTALHYAPLSSNEGWGVVGMIALLFIGFCLLIVDLVLQIFVKNKKTFYWISVLILLATFIFLVADF